MNQNFVRNMEKACKLAAQVLEKTGALVAPGVTTNELDKYADGLTLAAGATSAPLNYHGFPKAICTSVNSVLCHGIPDDTSLKAGDIVNIDITVNLNGYFGDCSATYYVGLGNAPEIVRVAYEAMMAGIQRIRPNGHTGDIGWASNGVAKANGMVTAELLGGHGIGKAFHMKPHVPGNGQFGTGDILRPWTCITVEPIVCESSAGYNRVTVPNSKIEYYTMNDHSLAAQFEHTVLITDTGYVILTIP